MKKFIVMLASLVMCLYAQSQDIKYDAASIPEPLKKGAHVVKRYERIFFEVTDLDRAMLKTHQVYTVLDGEGKDYLAFREHTNKFSSLEDVEIRVFDANGKQVNKYKKKDLGMNAYGDGLIDDGKTFGMNVPVSDYPVTVEFKTEIKYRATLFYPSYEILSPEMGVENSTFIAKVPASLDLRYKEKNIGLAPVISEEDKSKQYMWSVKNLKPIVDEEGAVSYRHRYPSIMLAPNHFKMDDYEGDMSSWKNFGKWYGQLKKGIDVLPADRQAALKELVKNASTNREKVKIVYEYLQKNFRYVSIQLGIGGYKPFPAVFTDQKRYGDCKALSNYMEAALDAIGIKSHQALINSQYNDEPVDPNFPVNTFNHAILCVPDVKDSIWLECTSNTSDFGVLGSSTENRNALLITEDGGVLVPTPKSKSSDNVFRLTTTIDLSENGNGKSTSVFNTEGSFKEMIGFILDEKRDDQKESIVYWLGFKQPDEFVFSKKADVAPLVTTLEMAIEKVPEFIAGNKMFISPRLYKLWPSKLPKADNRQLDFYFRYPFDKTDTTIIKLPAGYTVDALPQVKTLTCKQGDYSTKYWYDEAQKAIYSTAQLTLKQHKIPAADYAEVKKFFDAVLMDDAQRIVIRKN
jgi:hypothetical protein